MSNQSLVFKCYATCFTQSLKQRTDEEARVNNEIESFLRQHYKVSIFYKSFRTRICLFASLFAYVFMFLTVYLTML